ncbi:MAG: NADP-dependent malic enzyme [Deltaproteobacteria bacterium]|nr:NADP-dependent malic enzyme [Deltaproteobacteria bacterium]
MDYLKESLRAHYEWKGKFDIIPKMAVADKESLSLAYTPGVAAACLAIQDDPLKSFALTGRWNSVAVITDGTAVLGLGDIGPLAGMPVMEGKCVLFKAFGGVNAYPLCLKTTDPDAIVETVRLISGNFGGINLEDVSAPRCFEIERRLKEVLDIPVFHDDQHGTAVVVLAALANALKVAGKEMGSLKVAISGAGAAGVAIVKLLARAGLQNAILCDRQGAIYEGRGGLNPSKEELAKLTNPNRSEGSLAETLRGADVFIGVSGANIVTPDMVRTMAKDAIVLAMANPIPEIDPKLALEAGAKVVGTGRSDFPNQINNALAFPGIFRGALDARASDINDEMLLAASRALAGLMSPEELSPTHIIPLPFDPRVKDAVAGAVIQAARETGVARL